MPNKITEGRRWEQLLEAFSRRDAIIQVYEETRGAMHRDLRRQLESELAATDKEIAERLGWLNDAVASWSNTDAPPQRSASGVDLSKPVACSQCGHVLDAEGKHPAGVRCPMVEAEARTG